VKRKTSKPVTMKVAANDEFHIEALDSAALHKTTFSREWLSKHVLVLDKPRVLGGPKKTLKTSLLVDMAVSIGTGRPFLGKFPVPQRRRVAVFSGESGQATLQDTARRVCAARGVSLGDCLVHWSVQLPRLNQKGHRLALHALGHRRCVRRRQDCRRYSVSRACVRHRRCDRRRRRLGRR
jgi:RecA-family ATPase